MSNKLLDIFLMPNLGNDRIEKYLKQIKVFLTEQNVETVDSMLDKYSNTGLITVKLNKQSTLKLLEKTSFIFKVNETPQIDKEFLDVNSGAISRTPTESTMITDLQSFPEVCVVDTGVNSILPLTNLISKKSHEDNIPDDQDYDDHGTPVAYLVAYGERNKARAKNYIP